MKKIYLSLLSVSVCLMFALILPRTGISNEYVDSSSGCLTCHTVSAPGTGSAGEQHYDHQTESCDSCHEGSYETGTVKAATCTECLFEKCKSVRTHESDHGAICLTCHADCKEDETTTTTTTEPVNPCPSVLIYGEDSDEVAILRAYRDEVLSETPAGQKLISLYYKMSPVMVIAIENSEILKLSLKKRMDALLPAIEAQLLAK